MIRRRISDLMINSFNEYTGKIGKLIIEKLKNKIRVYQSNIRELKYFDGTNIKLVVIKKLNFSLELAFSDKNIINEDEIHIVSKYFTTEIISIVIILSKLVYSNNYSIFKCIQKLKRDDEDLYSAIDSEN